MKTEEESHHFPQIAVVIVTFESARVIESCLAALSRAAQGVTLTSVVVVDNASSDRSCALAREVWPDIIIAQSQINRGYAAAINLGRDACGQHDALLVLNPDAQLEAAALAKLEKALREPKCAMTVPRMLSADGELALSLRRWPTIRTALAEAVLGGTCAASLNVGETVGCESNYVHPQTVDWATGAAVLIASSSWEELGGWDESFFLYSEETEYMLRAQKAGLEVRYVPDAVCKHKGGDSGSSPQLWALLVTNKVRLYARTHGTVNTNIFRGCLLLGQGMRALTGDTRARKAAYALLHSISATASSPNSK